MPKPKEMGFGWKEPPKDRSTQMWPDSFPISGKRDKSPHGKGVASSRAEQVRGFHSPSKPRPNSTKYGYVEGMSVSSSLPQHFRFYYKNRIGNWLSEIMDREQASNLAQSFGQDLPDWNEECSLNSGQFYLKAIGIEK